MFDKLKKQNNIYIFYAVFLVLLFLSFKVVGQYISLIILAFIIVTIFEPFYKFIERKTKRRSIATAVSTTTVILFIIVPIAFLINITIFQFVILYEDLQNFLDNSSNNVESSEESDTRVKNLEYFLGEVNEVLEDVPYVDLEVTVEDVREFAKDTINPAFKLGFNVVKNNGGMVFNVPTTIIIFIYLLGVMFPNQQNIIKYIKKLSPFNEEIDNMYITRFIDMSHGMIRGSLVISIIQGLISGILLWIIGIDYVIFLTILMIFLSLIPLGAGFINFPIGIGLILTGNILQGILVIFNHLVVITHIDELLRPRLVKKESQLPPVLVIISVIGGIKYFGFFGFIFGPVVIIFLITTIQVYMKYFKDEDKKVVDKLTKESGFN